MVVEIEEGSFVRGGHTKPVPGSFMEPALAMDWYDLDWMISGDGAAEIDIIILIRSDRVDNQSDTRSTEDW